MIIFTKVTVEMLMLIYFFEFSIKCELDPNLKPNLFELFVIFLPLHYTLFVFQRQLL